MEDKMQHNSNRIGTLFQVESESLSKKEKNPHEAALSLIKGVEGVNPRQPKAMANTEQEIEKVAKLQEAKRFRCAVAILISFSLVSLQQFISLLFFSVS